MRLTFETYLYPHVFGEIGRGLIFLAQRGKPAAMLVLVDDSDHIVEELEHSAPVLDAQILTFEEQHNSVVDNSTEVRLSIFFDSDMGFELM